MYLYIIKLHYVKNILHCKIGKTLYDFNMMQDKIKNSFLMGASGDALGAPLEGLRSLEKIKNIYGDKGLTHLIPYKSHFEEGAEYLAGSITDDTTMAMTTALAIVKTLENNECEKLHYYSWQGYMQWAMKQINYPKEKALIDSSIKWDDLAKSFWFACGAGKGTLAALAQSGYGSVAKPFEYECEISGKILKSPNLGCGGMMRIAPIAFLPYDDKKIFEIACENAAITHGGQSAYVATGITALFTHYAAKGKTAIEIIEATKETVKNYTNNPLYKDGIAESFKIIDHVASLPRKFDFEIMDNITVDLGYKNRFLSAPVLANVTYAVLYADNKDKLKNAMVMSVNHAGDTDSVGAIAGNILGARFGVVEEWTNKLQQKQEIIETASRLNSALYKIN